MFNPLIFREYDIRGVYREQFDEDFAFSLGQAHAAYVCREMGVRSPTLTVGHDARLSSPALADAIARGMQASGCRVLTLGLITTPISYFSTFVISGVSGGIMVTGSHNPPEYNGFKVSVGNTTIFGDKIQNLKKIIEEKAFLSGVGAQEPYDIFPQYLQRYKEEFLGLRPIPVVLDCGNGVAGCIVRRLYEGIGLKPQILFEEPDGRFPNHHPDPTVEKNVKALIDTVQKSHAAVGFGFDGDADRIGVIDEAGRMVLGDELMMVVAKDLLSKKKNQTIIGDVKCSDRLYQYIEKHGGRGIMWKTGHSLIKQKIKDEHAPFGGELSGHIFFADRNYGYDDSLYASLRVIEILSKTGKSLSELLADVPKAYSTPEIRIDTTEEKKLSIVETLRTKFAARKGVKLNLIDGIRISFSDGWALARASNTQPVLVVRFESNTEAGLSRIQSEIESIINPLL